jgi:AraC-like DNA-binding protein/mannose-6-phosphate isomerase-like protein (cupin superfamily)
MSVIARRSHKAGLEMENQKDSVNVNKLISKLKYMRIELAHHYTCQEPLYGEEHLHELTYQFTYIINGKCTCSIGGKKREVFPGYAIYIPAKIKHASYDDTKTNFELIEIKVSFGRYSFVAGMSRTPDVVAVQNKAGLVASLERFLESCVLEGRDHWLTRIRLAEVIMLFYNERNASLELSSPHDIDLKVKQAVRYIQFNYSKLLTVQNIADLVNVSPSYFANSFKTIMKVSPMEFIREVRLNYAKELLQSSGLTVTEIARICGFSSPKYMARLFLRKLGVTPTVYHKRKGS